jgi:endonuclease/exonuclease/phosphatase family metal-dependent hydrolase
MKKTMKKLFAILLTLATVISLLPAALTASAETAPPALVITEVCFNPTFRDNDKDMSNTEDVLEYVEVYNPGTADVSLADAVMRLAKGYGKDAAQNAVIAVSDNPRVIGAGKTAVFVCYQATSATLGYGYATDEEIRAYYDFFCDFYGCADTVSIHDFYVIPRAESGTDKKISGGFNLGNTTEEVVLTLCRGDEVLAECYYSAKLWNKNSRSVNMMWQEGMDAEHPLASKAVTTAGCTPGYVYASQVPAASLTAPENTLPVRAMAYNLQAEAKEQTAADGTVITDAMRTDRIFKAIGEHDPDVLVLCEINYRWLELLEGNLIGEGGQYAAYGRSGSGKYHDGKQTGDIWDLTSLVLWKTEKYDCVKQGTFWCSRTPDRHGSASWDGGLTGDIPRAINWVILEEKTTGDQFLFVGAHLDAKTAEIRALSAALIAEMTAEFACGLPTVNMGDFNCSDNSAAYRGIHGTTLYDARYLVPTYGGMTILGTFNKFGENTDMQVRLPIDLCFVTPATVWVESAKSDYAFADEGNSVYASDHNAIIFDLKLQKLHTVEPETEAPTEAPTEPPTEPPTEAPTAPDSEPSDTPAETDPPKGGCGAVLPMAALIMLLPSVVILYRKRED